MSVKRTSFTPGEYWDLRELFVPSKSALDAPPGTPRKGKVLRFEVASPSLTVKGEPDPDHVYYLEVGGSGTLKQVAHFQLAESGAVTGMLSEVDNQTSDVILAAFGGLTGALTRSLFRAGAAKPLTPSDAPCKPAESFNCFLEDYDLQQNFLGLSPEWQSHYEAVFASPEKDRLVAAAKKYARDIREYMELTRRLREGSVPIGPQLEFVVKERDRILAERTRALFTEQAQEATWTGTFYVRPAALSTSQLEAGTAPTPVVLFSLDPGAGICAFSEGAELAGLRPPARFLAVKRDCNDVRLEFELTPKDQFAQVFSRHFVQSEAGNSTRGSGYRFRVPARTRVELVVSEGPDKAKHTGRWYVMVAQFGALGIFPADLGGKTVAFDTQFYEASGALKSFKLTSQPLLTKGVVEAVSTSTNALFDARNKQLEAASKAADELTQLERRRKLLEERKKIREYCEALGLSEAECER